MNMSWVAAGWSSWWESILQIYMCKNVQGRESTTYRDADRLNTAVHILFFDISQQQIIPEERNVWAVRVCDEPSVNRPRKFQNVTTVSLALCICCIR
jgi:hypothetical protein